LNRQSTVRLPLALLLTLGATVAAMLGRPEAALFAVPWVVLLILGISSTGAGAVRAQIELKADRVMVGDDVPIDVTIESDADGWIEIRPTPVSTFWPSPAEGPSSLALATATGHALDAGRAISVSCPLPARVWGTHDIGRLDILFHESYGLFEWHGSVKDARSVRVHPSPLDLRRLLSPWLVRRQSGVHPSTDRARGVEFADIRPFGSGDSLRDINWRASARSDRILVSQRHPERSTDVVLLIDSFDEAGLDLRTVVGGAVEAAIALAESHLSLTDRVGLVDLGGVIRWIAPGTGQQQLQRLVDALLATRLYATAAERSVSLVPRHGLPPRSFVLALSPMLDKRFVDALYILQAAGHDVAVIESPRSVVDERPGHSDVAHLALQMFNAERAAVRDQLASRGVIVGQWHQGDHLDAAVADIINRRGLARVARR
jgi:uncharacterized protein (DUF58 family)